MKFLIRKDKKGFQFMMIVSIFIVILSLILLLFYFKDMLQNSNNENSILECSLTFKNVAGKSAFFSDNGEKINIRLKKLIAGSCPYEVKKNSDIEHAVNLVEDCYKKTDKGKNIFVSSANGEKLCLYCGEITFSKDIDNFGEKFVKELKKRNDKYLLDSNTINLNKYLLFDTKYLPKSVHKDEILNIVYVTKYLNKNDESSYILSKILNDIGYSSSANSDDVVSGINLMKFKKDGNSDFFQKYDENSYNEFSKKLLFNCGNNLIIPDKHFS